MEPVYQVLWISATKAPPGAEDVVAWSVNNVKCNTCSSLLEIYGSCESVAPWLCMCEEKSAAQSSLQQTLVEVKPRRRIGRLLVPQIGAELRKRWLDAQK